MTTAPEEHTLAVEEGRVSPVVVVVTLLMILLFIVAILYRLGVTVL